MADEVKKLLSQGRSFWSGLTLPKKAVLVGGVGVIATILFLVATRKPVEQYEVLFSGLTPEDSAVVAEELKKVGVPYHEEAGGTILRVPANKVAEMRISLASSGHPQRSAVGFEIFDKQTFGTTGFVEQMNYRRALQGELERTIAGLGVIESARVHIAMPERSLFRERDEAPSASVVVRLFKGRAVSPSQVRGIVNLVAFSVPGLLVERVSLVDDTGRVLSESEGADGLDKQHDLESTLTRRVRGIVERVVGEGHAEVQITAEMDFTKVTTTEELYDKDKAVLRSEQRTADWTGANDLGVGGVAGARGNLPGTPPPQTVTPPVAAAPPPGTPTPPPGVVDRAGAGKMSETKNYEVSKTTQLSQGGMPRIRRLHVAILVDGIPDPAWKPLKPEDVAPMVSRPDADLTRLASLAKQAVGFDDGRGDKLEIQSSAFVFPTLPVAKVPESPWPPWMRTPRNQLILKAGALLVGIVLTALFLVLIVRSMRMKGHEETIIVPTLPRQIRDVEAELQAPMLGTGSPLAAAMGMGDMGAFAGSPAELPPAPPAPLKPRDLATEAARNDIAKAVRVISAWLAEVPSAPPPVTPGKGGK